MLLIDPTKELLQAFPPPLLSIAEKVVGQKRLSAEEGLQLLQSEEHMEAIGRLANYARQRAVGDVVYYATTLYIHPTNLCELSCPMCSFYAKPGWEKSWFMTPEQIEDKVRNAYSLGINEVHVVGGLWRDCNLDYYQDVFTRIKNIDLRLHIKALTPVEYDFLAKLHNLSIEEVFLRMMSWGLGSLPGGGAEILVESIRKQIAPQKITSDEYLAIVKIAHKLGLPSNITMLFGHVEEPRDIITHLCRVRELQDETGGFVTFAPLKYHVENNALGKRKHRLRPPIPLKLLYAVCRLMLDNIRNLKVLWNYLGVETAQQLLNYGANDFSSTNDQEKIIQMAGGVRLKMTREMIHQFIEQIGRIPQEVHSGYKS